MPEQQFLHKPSQRRANWNRPLAGPQQPGAFQQVAVSGQSTEPAYQRRLEARPVTFTCIVCGQEKTEYRYPGFRPRYCGDACRNRAAEERNRERVRKQREKRTRERQMRTNFRASRSLPADRS